MLCGLPVLFLCSRIDLLSVKVSLELLKYLFSLRMLLSNYVWISFGLMVLLLASFCKLTRTGRKFPSFWWILNFLKERLYLKTHCCVLTPGQYFLWWLSSHYIAVQMNVMLHYRSASNVHTQGESILYWSCAGGHLMKQPPGSSRGIV